MRFRDQPAYLEKVHTSVQSMIAQARQIIRPKRKLSSPFNSSNSHIEVLIPPHLAKQHLKPTSISLQNYKTIQRDRAASLDRSKEISLNKVENLDIDTIPQRQETQLLLTRVSNRYHLKNMISNYESELVDQKMHHLVKKNKRPLYKKKTVNLLPQLPDIFSHNSHSRQFYLKDEPKSENSEGFGPKYYLTITEQDLMKARKKVQQFLTIDPALASSGQNKSQLKVKEDDKIKQYIQKKQQKKILQKKQKKIKAKVNTTKDIPQFDEQKYQPWSLEPVEGDIF